MTDHDTTSSIVVGIDGSKSGVRAAVWAAEEAAMRGLAVRVIYVIEDQPDGAEDGAGAAQAAIAEARKAINATATNVHIETDVLRGRPLSVLAKASASAEMVCVGPVGRHRIAQHRVGSTAAALAASAHCPVAIIRVGDPPDTGSIIVDLDDSPEDTTVLRRAMEEAQLRQVPLEVVTTWQSTNGDTHDEQTIDEGNHRVQAQLGRKLERWTRRYPDVDVLPVAAYGSILDYLTNNTGTIQLVVVGAGAPGDASELLGPAGNAVLRKTDCSVLVVARHHL